jgi:hypothetical protein
MRRPGRHPQPVQLQIVQRHGEWDRKWRGTAIGYTAGVVGHEGRRVGLGGRRDVAIFARRRVATGAPPSSPARRETQGCAGNALDGATFPFVTSSLRGATAAVRKWRGTAIGRAAAVVGLEGRRVGLGGRRDVAIFARRRVATAAPPSSPARRETQGCAGNALDRATFPFVTTSLSGATAAVRAVGLRGDAIGSDGMRCCR